MTIKVGFNTCLALGETAQRNFAKELLDVKGDTFISIEFARGNFKDWDIKITYEKNKVEYVETYEVKSDTKSEETGRFVLEYEYRGHNSGIEATKADYWAHYADGKRWVQDVQELKKRLATTKKGSVPGGDNNWSRMWLLDCNQLPALFDNSINDMNEGKKKLEDFLKEFNQAWYGIKDPKEKLEEFFDITEDGEVSLKLSGDTSLYIGKISDVDLSDIQNVVNTIKVLVNNYLLKWERKPKQNSDDEDGSVLIPA